MKTNTFNTMNQKAKWRADVLVTIVTVVVALAANPASADDLVGSSRFLCTALEATVCAETGECVTEMPFELNFPQFIEVDLEARRLATTAASGENRATPIDHLIREGGAIVFHGYEMGRAFSWVISEPTGRVSAAVATDGLAVAVFGACTPMDGSAETDVVQEGVTP